MQRNCTFFTLSGAHGDAHGPVWADTLPRCLAHAPHEGRPAARPPSEWEPL